MVERKEYLDQLWAWKDERQIKVVTGIRRCGKSVLLEQYQQRLLANGDRKSTRLNSSHNVISRMPSSA